MEEEQARNREVFEMFNVAEDLCVCNKHLNYDLKKDNAEHNIRVPTI